MIDPPRGTAFCYWFFQSGHLFLIGYPRREADFYWLSQRRHLLLLVLSEMVASVLHEVTLCPSGGPGCRIPRMLGPCGGPGQPGQGWDAVDLPSAGSKEGPWQSSLGDRLALPLSPSPGCVHLQCCADDPSHHGELRLPQVGPGRGLAHGPVFHGPHPRIHGLHVPHLKGLPEAGKPIPYPSGRWAPLYCAEHHPHLVSTVCLGRRQIASQRQ